MDSGEENPHDPSNHKTIFNLDYEENHDILAMCGNFADVRLVKGSMQELME